MTCKVTPADIRVETRSQIGQSIWLQSAEKGWLQEKTVGPKSAVLYHAGMEDIWNEQVSSRADQVDLTHQERLWDVTKTQWSLTQSIRRL